LLFDEAAWVVPPTVVKAVVPLPIKEPVVVPLSVRFAPNWLVPTAPLAIAAEVTAPAASCALPTAPLASWVPVIEPGAIVAGTPVKPEPLPWMTPAR